MKDLLHRAGFHGIALMHNQHPIGNIRHHPHIVGDENHPHLHLLLQYLNQLQDLGLKLSASQMQGVRGADIAMIFQEPMTSLNRTPCIRDALSSLRSIT